MPHIGASPIALGAGYRCGASADVPYTITPNDEILMTMTKGPANYALGHMLGGTADIRRRVSGTSGGASGRRKQQGIPRGAKPDSRLPPVGMQ